MSRHFVGKQIDTNAQYESALKHAARGMRTEFHVHGHDEPCAPSTNERSTQHCWTTEVIENASEL